MKIHSPLFLLAAVLSPAAWAAVDTSNWKCTACPYPKDSTGSVDVGVIATSDDSAKFGDYTGLQDKGAHLDLGGTLQYRGEAGGYADLSASDLGLSTRVLNARGGQEGLYTLRLGYSELPRHLSNNAMTPFLGSGGASLSLPKSYPAAGTSTMPLATTLQPVDLGFNKKQLDLSGTLIALDDWTLRVGFSHDVRDGTRPVYGSFFASSSQLVAPIDQVTDQLEVSASYARRGLQASVGYLLSRFSNSNAALSWDNPFLPVVAGATRGQLALAPDNQLQQLTGSAAYDITPTIRASAEAAIGRMTQNAAYLAPTLNTALAASVPALPARSLDGKVDTFNANLKVTATLLADLRLTAVYARDERTNVTASLTYPLVATDMYLDTQTRKNTPFTTAQDRLKVSADYRGFQAVKLSAGADQDNRHRSYTEAVTTRETTVWARVGMQPLQNLSLSLKGAHAERESSPYGTSIWFGSPENPLMRKYNLAGRKRDTAGGRADWALSEKWSLGLAFDYANDSYTGSAIGLGLARDVNVSVDISAALSEKTQLTMFAQSERINSRQSGSEAFAAPDWSAQNKDQFDVVGLSIKHTLIADKFDIGADITSSRARSEIEVQTVVNPAQFPQAKTSVDRIKLMANYKLSAKLGLNASYWYERYESQDWHADGVLPGTVQNLLSFGQQAPSYRVNVLAVSLRYKF